ncbi:MAG: hypothetical protein ACP5E3_16835 [Bacteroidales bacterium]
MVERIRSGQAQLALRNRCITGILEAETAYRMETVKRFIDRILIDAADDQVFQETVSSKLIPITRDRIGPSGKQERVDKIQDSTL